MKLTATIRDGPEEGGVSLYFTPEDPNKRFLASLSIDDSGLVILVFSDRQTGAHSSDEVEPTIEGVADALKSIRHKLKEQ